MENPTKIWMIWGHPYFRTPPYIIVYCHIMPHYVILYMSYDVVLHNHIMPIYAIFVCQILNNHDFWGVLLETSTCLSWRQQRSSCDILRSLAQTTLPRAVPHHWETHWLQYSRAEKSLANVSIAPIFGYTGVPRKIDKETTNIMKMARNDELSILLKTASI